MKVLIARVRQFDQWLIALFVRYAHFVHRISLGTLFIWFGLLKPLGHKTTTSILAHSIYWGDPDTIVAILGWWEVAIGVCLIIRPLVRVAILLLVIRLPGVILAFILKPDVCFYSFPFAPTPEGQYLIKDLVIFIATLAIAGGLRYEKRPGHLH
ncbi:MAG: hypothetical protein OER43_12730 [Gammaproteobacteria bacterium]|nr:hypothetical protein [Gammaproteobacteria bacterium]MDH3411552.1 hypothetical protein [Gammaproteobacteria bacterium]